MSAYRALLDGGQDAARVALAGESAGANLAVVTLAAIARAGLPQPSSAVLMSPWADLAGTGDSIKTKADADPVLTAEAVHVRARDYLGDADACDPAVSPLYARLPGVPHVFQAFAAVLDEGEAALTRAGAFLRAHIGTAVAGSAGQQE